MTHPLPRSFQVMAGILALLLAFLLLPGRASGQTATAPSPAVVGAIHAVIQQANQEQEQAFAQDNPALMQDTCTADYYTELTQAQQQLKANGVTGIQLLGIDWGAVQLLGANRAKAITAESWQTTFS